MAGNEIMRRRIGRVIQKRAGVLASFLYSGANFIVLFFLQHQEGAVDFGVFALSQLFFQLGIGVCNALFCSPLTVSAKGQALDQATILSFTKANMVFCAFGITLTSTALFVAGGQSTIIVFSGLLNFLGWSRWFFRGVEIAQGNRRSPVFADIYYSLVVIVLAGAGIGAGILDTNTALLIQASGAITALWSMNRAIWMAWRDSFQASLEVFKGSFSRHGRWALLGVATTEITANAHSYTLAFIVGPQALAVVASVSLLFRPLMVLTQTLTQYERPKLSSAYAASNSKDFNRVAVEFRTLSIGAWLFNSLAVTALLISWPSLIGNGRYDLTTVIGVSALIGTAFLARSLRAAESAALQAVGQFKLLANITLKTAPVTLIGTLFCTLAWPNYLSLTLIPMVLGEALMAALIYRAFSLIGKKQTQQALHRDQPV